MNYNFIFISGKFHPHQRALRKGEGRQLQSMELDMKKGSRRVKSKSLLARLLGNSKGSVAVYVGLVSPVLVGLGSLTIDLGRLMSLNIELQSAADAASLACARELDRTTGSQARCRAAAANAVLNMETFAADGFAATDIIKAGDEPSGYSRLHGIQLVC